MALNQKSFGDIITFTRASSATRINSLGQMESVAANVPRIDYDPVTLAARGLLVEEQRTNLLLNSLIDGTPLATQSVTVTAVAHTLSFYGSGSVALSGAYTGNLVGAGTYPARNSLTFTPVAGTLTLTVTGDVKFAQVEPGAVRSSFIPTAAAQSTRTPDFPLRSLSIERNPAAFTVFVEWTNTNGVSAANLGGVVTIGDSTTDLVQVNHSSDGSISSYAKHGSDTRLAAPVVVANQVTPHRYAIGYSNNGDISSAYGGVVKSISGVLSPVSNITTLHIGRSLTAGVLKSGHIRKICYFPRRLSDAELQALTA